MEGLLNFIRSLGTGRMLAMGAIAAGLIGLFAVIMAQMSKPKMALLYSDLDPGDANQIVRQLETQQIPFELRDDGRTIYAPKDQIPRLRVGLASSGLSGGVVGYEIFDRTDSIGTTSFVQNINQVRALEGELSRTIKEIGAVNSARVHIVMPQRELFSREEQKPSASIVLHTARGGLSREQISAIQHLVAGAVPKMDATRVSIVDQNGSLLAKSSTGDDSVGLAATADERRIAIENRLRDQIESLLAGTVGAGHVRTEVRVELDMSRVTTQKDDVDPDRQVVISSSTSSGRNQNSERGGGSVSVQNNLPDAQSASGQGGPSSMGSQDEETVNYEVAKTHTTTIQDAGTIKKISVAVLVDGVYTGASQSNPGKYSPRSQAELNQLTQLVRSAIGFDADRGDQVSVVNLKFAPIEDAAADGESGSFLTFIRGDMAGILSDIVLGIVLVLALLLVVRPIVMRVLATLPSSSPAPALAGAGNVGYLPNAAIQAQLAPPDNTNEIMAEIAARAAQGDGEAQNMLVQARERGQLPANLNIETAIDVASVEGRVREGAINKVGEIIARHPEESTAIVRSWLYGS